MAPHHYVAEWPSSQHKRQLGPFQKLPPVHSGGVSAYPQPLEQRVNDPSMHVDNVFGPLAVMNNSHCMPSISGNNSCRVDETLANTATTSPATDVSAQHQHTSGLGVQLLNSNGMNTSSNTANNGTGNVYTDTLGAMLSIGDGAYDSEYEMTLFNNAIAKHIPTGVAMNGTGKATSMSYHGTDDTYKHLGFEINLDEDDTGITGPAVPVSGRYPMKFVDDSNEETNKVKVEGTTPLFSSMTNRPMEGGPHDSSDKGNVSLNFTGTGGATYGAQKSKARSVKSEVEEYEQPEEKRRKLNREASMRYRERDRERRRQVKQSQSELAEIQAKYEALAKRLKVSETLVTATRDVNRLKTRRMALLEKRVTSMRGHFQAMSDLIYDESTALTDAEREQQAEGLIEELLAGERNFVKDWSAVEGELKELMLTLQNVYVKTSLPMSAPHASMGLDSDHSTLLENAKRGAGGYSYSSEASSEKDLYIPPQLVGFGFGWIEATASLLGVEDEKQKETMLAAEQVALRRLLPYMAQTIQKLGPKAMEAIAAAKTLLQTREKMNDDRRNSVSSSQSGKAEKEEGSGRPRRQQDHAVYHEYRWRVVGNALKVAAGAAAVSCTNRSKLSSHDPTCHGFDASAIAETYIEHSSAILGSCVREWFGVLQPSQRCKLLLFLASGTEGRASKTGLPVIPPLPCFLLSLINVH